MPDYKTRLAVDRAKQRIQNSKKIQALKNYYDQINLDQQARQENNEKTAIAQADADMDHKASLALARSLNNHSKLASSLSEGAETFINIVEGPKWKAPFAGLKMAHHFRQQVKEHDNSPFWVMLIWAIIVDVADITWLIGFLLKLPLFYFLFGRGTWKARMAARIFRRIVIMMIADLIPFVSWIPFSTISVIYAWKKSAEEARKAKKKIKELEKDRREYDKLPPNQEVYIEEVEMEEAYA